MSSAYVGNLAMPPLFGVLANNITPALFPFYLLVVLVLMVLMAPAAGAQNGAHLKGSSC